jgi:transposase
MPKPYSANLRGRALLAGEAGARPAQVAAQFRVGLSTVYLWRKQAREDGRRAAKPHAGGPAPEVTAAGHDRHDVIRSLVEEDGQATLAESVERFAARTGQTISRALMCELLQRLDLPRKKDAPGRGAGARRYRGRAPSLPGPKRGARPGPAGVHRRGGDHDPDDARVRPRARGPAPRPPPRSASLGPPGTSQPSLRNPTSLWNWYELRVVGQFEIS